MILKININTKIEEIFNKRICEVIKWKEKTKEGIQRTKLFFFFLEINKIHKHLTAWLRRESTKYRLLEVTKGIKLLLHKTVKQWIENECTMSYSTPISYNTKQLS